MKRFLQRFLCGLGRDGHFIARLDEGPRALVYGCKVCGHVENAWRW